MTRGAARSTPLRLDPAASRFQPSRLHHQRQLAATAALSSEVPQGMERWVIQFAAGVVHVVGDPIERNPP